MTDNRLALVYFILVFTLATTIACGIASILLGIDPADLSGDTPLQILGLSSIQLLVTLLIVWFFYTKVDKKRFDFTTLKINYEKLRNGLMLALIMIIFGFYALILIDQVKIAGITFNVYDLLTNFGSLLLIAITEEIALRGYLLKKLLEITKRSKAIIISAMIFGFFHIFNPNISWLSLIALFLSGLLLGAMYIYTESLGFLVMFHFGWNFFQGPVFGFQVSGLYFPSIINQINHGNNIWNGGAFGFEGSIISMLLQISALLITFRLIKKVDKERTNIYS
jgi:membrane protease YdiL (CAAX protease family)